MIGRWMVRFLFIGALCFVAVGIVDLEFDPPLAESNGLEGDENEDASSLEFVEEDADNREPVEDNQPDDSADGGLLFIGLGGSILGMLFLGSGLLEIMKVSVIMALVVPLLAKHSKSDERNRGRILGFIEGHAGIHFSALRDALHLANGVTAHHLHVLEQENAIVSWRDGARRRYAASHLTPEEQSTISNPPVGTRLAILETLAGAGKLGLKNTEIAAHLQLSRQLLSYHMKHLSEASLIEKSSSRKRALWRLTEQGVNALGTPVTGERKINSPIPS